MFIFFAEQQELSKNIKVFQMEFEHVIAIRRLLLSNFTGPIDE